MKPTKLVIRNFLSIQEADLNLADKGLVSIEGVNLDNTGSDSNGSGKSSFINALLWCLYGSYGKNELADDVVNSDAGKDCMVQTIWEDTIDEIGFVRYRITRYRKHSKFKNALKVEINFDGDDSHWNEITKAGTGMAQAQINDIMGADEMVFRASCFQQQEDTIDIPSMRDGALKDLLERCLPFEDLSSRHDQATENVVNQKVVVRKLEDEIKLKEWQIDQNGNELAEARRAYDTFDDRNNSANERALEELKKKRLARAVAASRATGYEALEKEAKSYTDKARAITGWSTDEPTMGIRYAQRDIDEQTAILENPDNKCGSCGQVVADMSVVIKNAKEKLQAAEDELDKWTVLLETAKANKAKRTHYLNEGEKLYYEIADKKNAKRSYEVLDAEIKALEASLVRSAVNPHGDTVKRLEKALRASQEGKLYFEAQLKEARTRLELLEAVQLTYSPQGLRYHMLETVAPKLTDYTNNYLSVLTDGAITAIWSTVTRTSTGDFREKFSIEAKMGSRNKFGLLSGGQKRKVRLACFFALQDLIAERATKDIDIWCGDEIDEALDGAGLERLMVLLNEKVKAKSTILVISHNEMREWIPNHAIVTMENGQSTITGYLND